MSNKNLLNEELRRMKTLAGILSENSESSDKTFLKEEILELKQMSKQLYSFLKSKGFPVELTNKIKEPIMPQNPKSTGTITRDKQSVKSDINVETVQIQVTEGKDENVIVAVTPSNVARVIVGGGNDWSHKASEKFGNDWGTWQKNPEIVNYVNKLGNELLAQIKSKYPNMVYQFAQEPFYYVLKFGYAQTKKGGQLDPNKVKNPAPQQQGAPEQKVAAESVKKGLVKKTIKEDSAGTDKETLTTPVKTPPKTTPDKKENPLKIPKPGPGTRPNPKAEGELKELFGLFKKTPFEKLKASKDISVEEVRTMYGKNGEKDDKSYGKQNFGSYGSMIKSVPNKYDTTYMIITWDDGDGKYPSVNVDGKNFDETDVKVAIENKYGTTKS